MLGRRRLGRYLALAQVGQSGHLFVGDLFFGTMWPGMALDMLIADTALAGALYWALYRNRRHARSKAATA